MELLISGAQDAPKPNGIVGLLGKMSKSSE